MTKQVPENSQSSNVREKKGTLGQPTTGEGAASAFAVLRDRCHVDLLIERLVDLGTDCTELPG